MPLPKQSLLWKGSDLFQLRPATNLRIKLGHQGKGVRGNRAMQAYKMRKKQAIRHLTVAAYHTASISLAERPVQTVKQGLNEINQWET